MYKKSLIFIITIIYCNLSYGNYPQGQYPQSSQGQYPQHQQPSFGRSTKEIIQKTCEDKLEALKKEEIEQYSHTNICWGGAVVSVGAAIFFAAHSNWQLAIASALGILGFGTIGTVSMQNENAKAEARSKERNELLQKLHNLN